MLAALLGKPVEDLTVGDLQAMDMAQYAAMVGQIEALPEAERQRAVAHCSSLYTQWELTRKQGELEVDQTELRTEQVNHATRRLLDAVDGLEHDRSAKDMLERVGDLIGRINSKAQVVEAEKNLVQGIRADIIALATTASQAQRTLPLPAPASPQEPWDAHMDAFYRDKPDLAAGTMASHQQAFREFGELFPGKALGDVTKGDVKAFCDHLRDRPINRAGRNAMSRDTIVKLVGHLRGYFAWTVSAGYLTANPAEGVQPRAETRDERMSRDKRRAFSLDELAKLFDSPLFTGYYHLKKRSQPGRLQHRDEPFWFFAIALLTGARTEEIADLPAEFVDVGGIQCFDFRHASKTAAGPRLVPVLPDLWRMGLRQWAESQQRRGLDMVKGPEGSDDWSKWSNRYLANVGLKAPGLVTYSLRHTFRQALRGADLHEEIINKVFGHEGKSIGAGYGRDLAPSEAKLVIERVKAPVALDHLFIHGGN
ncbi:hypothetical protein [Nitrospirillum viridazoti]|uniref:Integrase n=2 Tax=Nitrospirillum TaxID=1543705 RepID=A0A248JZY2_9PROT|nr:hypothetical protein [Nitrospirillum amazonense]ASG24041.1 hypothetical protein Y958_24210 [Nitrospirillum amazonense CBAmc]